MLDHADEPAFGDADLGGDAWMLAGDRHFTERLCTETI